MSIDDYLDGLLSGSSEPSRKAIMKLTKLIENIGNIMVTSTERMEDYVAALNARISVIEQALGVASAGPAPQRAAPAAIPTQTAPTAPIPAPTVATGSNVGAPNLSGAPSGNVAAPSLSGGGNTQIPAPSVTQETTGGGISNGDLLKAAANLQKAPEQEPGTGPASTISPFGASATDLKDIKSGLTKVDQDEHRKERTAAQTGGSMPAGMALNLEVKEELAKRSSRSEEDDEEVDFAPTQAAPASPQRSTKQMKEALQGELRDAFSSLLESDDEEE